MKTPEHARLRAVHGEMQAAGDFLAWLGEQGFKIVDGTSELESRRNTEQWLAAWQDIDAQALEQEKRQMLEQCAALREVFA